MKIIKNYVRLISLFLRFYFSIVVIEELLDKFFIIMNMKIVMLFELVNFGLVGLEDLYECMEECLKMGFI